jgi:hypothetical protein
MDRDGWLFIVDVSVNSMRIDKRRVCAKSESNAIDVWRRLYEPSVLNNRKDIPPYFDVDDDNILFHVEFDYINNFPVENRRYK